MDPCYMVFGEVDSSAFHPYNTKKSCGIRVGPDLFRLVSVLGGGSSLVGGESAVWQFIVED